MFQQCSRCSRSFNADVSLTSRSSADFAHLCPECADQSEPKIAVEPGWISVARVSNLAEAGFLANDLAHQGIDARLFESESFSALAGGWSSTYLVQVPADDATCAADRIRIHLADDSGEDSAGDYSFFRGDDGPVDPVFWRPVALILIAGAASFIVGQQFAVDRLPPQQPLPRNSLPESVHAIGRSFVTEPAADRARHRLSYHRHRDCWYLETDADGDGHYESRERFHRNGASW